MNYTLLLLCLLLAHSSLGQNLKAQKIEAYMQAQRDVNDFSGAVLVYSSDTIVFKKAYGFADYEWNVPNTIDTKFGLASITKYITAIAILQLVEKGQLSLDDKLATFFPHFPKGDSVSVHMLLTHTSGLALDFENLYLDYTGITKDSAIASIAKMPYRFTPGTNSEYSNIGYFLLSEIIEKASGMSYSNYLQKYIFDVANMSNSGISNNDSIISKMARVYYRTPEGLVKNPYINWSLNIGHDGMYSTIEDLYMLDRALYGNTLLSETSKAKMTTQYNKKYPDNGFFETYGYGIFINPYYNHGQYLLTHSGGFYGVMTSLDRFTEDNVFITVLSNNQSESHIISYGLSGIMFDLPVEVPYKHTEVEIDLRLLDKYAGQYGKIKIIKIKDRLYLENTETELKPESSSKFFRADNHDRTVEFVTNKKGEAHALILTKGGVREIIQKDKRSKK